MKKSSLFTNNWICKSNLQAKDRYSNILEKRTWESNGWNQWSTRKERRIEYSTLIGGAKLEIHSRVKVLVKFRIFTEIDIGNIALENSNGFLGQGMRKSMITKANSKLKWWHISANSRNSKVQNELWWKIIPHYFWRLWSSA